MVELGWPAKALSPNARLDRLGRHQAKAYPPELAVELSAAYQAEGFNGVVNLGAIALKWGKNKGNLCRAAKALGLPINPKRRIVEKRQDRRKHKGDAEALKAAQSASAKKRLAANGHPRGMLGRSHTAEVRQLIAKQSAARWAAMSESERSSHIMKALKAKVARYGCINPQNERGSWKAGWREIDDKRHYFRSRWEANYARYLQWLKLRGDILDWEYEPETFWFDKIKRGVRSYLPDFRVHELNGTKPLHEVKGWMDARSRTTLRRMAKYHPGEKIILIREKEYRAISRFSSLIGGWE